MAINKYKIVGNVLLTFGLLGNNVYGSEDSGTVNATDTQQLELKDSGSEDFDAQQLESKEEKLREAVNIAGGTTGSLTKDFVGIAKLIRSGADFTCKDEEEQTLLYQALRPETLAALLWLPGININSRDITGNSVLHENVQIFIECLLDTLGSGKEEIKVLLECGADPLLENTEGKIALQFVEEWIEEEKALPPEERNINSEKAIGVAEEMVQILHDAGVKWRETH